MARSRGFGDSVEKFTKATGIKRVVNKVSGGNCGCGSRQAKLNKMFPYKGQSTGKSIKNRVVGGIKKN